MHVFESELMSVEEDWTVSSVHAVLEMVSVALLAPRMRGKEEEPQRLRVLVAMRKPHAEAVVAAMFAPLFPR